MIKLFPKTPPIQNFPNDNKVRVVWALGALFKNTTHATDLPLVEVSLREVLLTGELSEQATVAIISLAQVDTARLWSIWLGNKKTTQVWEKNDGYSREEEFMFNFKQHEPSSIKLQDKKPGTNYFYIPPYKYNLGKLPSTSNFVHFMNSTYTKLISENNITVLIPSIEFLTSTYIPEEQQIRNQLVMYTIDEVIEKNVKKFYYKDSKYHVHLKNSKRNTNISFLAYLSLNAISRKRLSKLWSSLSVANKDKNGQLYKDRYPVVLPYHPTSMKFKGSGIWLDSKTFLCLRINVYSLPINFASRCHYVVPKEKDKEKQTKPSGQNQYIHDEEEVYDFPIVSDENPHVKKGYVDIRSEVLYYDDEALDIDTIKEESLEDSDMSILCDNDRLDVEQLSSGEGSQMQDSKNTMGVKVKKLQKSKNVINQSELLHAIPLALESLCLDEKSDLVKIEYINEKLEFFEEVTFSCFPVSYEYVEANGTWATNSISKGKEKTEPSKMTARGVLLMRLTLKDDRFTYLLEIDRKLSTDSYSGLFFNVETTTLCIEELNGLLEQIMEYKGRYTQSDKYSMSSKRVKLNLPVACYETFDHKTINGSLALKMRAIVKKFAKEEFNVFKNSNT